MILFLLRNFSTFFNSLLIRSIIHHSFIKHAVLYSTNVYSIIGKTGIVTEEIDPIHSKGQIKVNGEVWSAISDSNTIIPENSKVEILEVKGVKAIVSPLNVTSKNIN